jgi:hypothetical protein
VPHVSHDAQAGDGVHARARSEVFDLHRGGRGPGLLSTLLESTMSHWSSVEHAGDAPRIAAAIAAHAT